MCFSHYLLNAPRIFNYSSSLLKFVKHFHHSMHHLQLNCQKLGRPTAYWSRQLKGAGWSHLVSMVVVPMADGTDANLMLYTYSYECSQSTLDVLNWPLLPVSHFLPLINATVWV